MSLIASLLRLDQFHIYIMKGLKAVASSEPKHVMEFINN